MRNKDDKKWHLIDGTESIYISNFGDVESEGGFVYKTFLDNAGYKRVNLKINGKTKGLLIHILVARYFVPNPFNKPQVNHKNGDRTNSCEWNLEWCTPYENQMHRKYVLGHGQEGEKNAMYGKTGRNNPKFKELVYAVDKDGKVVGIFETQVEAAIKVLGDVKKACQISRCLTHARNNLVCHGIYWLYETEYKQMTQADLKPCELLENPNVLVKTYRGQSATKPQ